MTTESRYIVASPPASRTAGQERDWRQTYAGYLFMTDFFVIVAVVFGAQLAWFGWDFGQMDALAAAAARTDSMVASNTVISLVLVGAWMIVLSIYGTRGYRVLGVGSTEYKLVTDASLRLFGLVAIVAFLLQVSLARGYILTAFPLGVLCLIGSRAIWRHWLSAKRHDGEYASRVLIVGSEASATHIARELARFPAAGYNVVGACVPSGRIAGYLPGTQIPVSTNLDQLAAAMEATGADTVLVSSSDELPPERVRQLSWGLEPGRQHLVVAPSLTDIGGPRIQTRPVAGLPLVHVETPRYAGSKQFSKRLLDLVLAGALVLALSPVLLGIMIAIKLGSPGPVFFAQERVGLNGTRFAMLKFRSMVTNAEALLDTLRSEQGAEGNDVMFKMKDDPRVTRIGRVLRRYSLDELPQLFNVLLGHMSIVGPRPPLEREVAVYESHVHRRFLVKPGITGLWQVSGRSNLSWEDTVRLDLYYVENWSITNDLTILGKTVRAVLAREGAY